MRRSAVDHGLEFAGEKPPVILPGLHHHGEIGKLCGPFVDVQPMEIVEAGRICEEELP